MCSLLLRDVTFHRLIAANLPPRMNGSNIFRVDTREASVYSFTVTDDGDGFTVAVQGGMPDGSTLEQESGNYTFTWTQLEPDNTSLVFVANDSLGAASTLSPRVEVCACQNRGNCTLDGILGMESNTVIMECECPEGMRYKVTGPYLYCAMFYSLGRTFL